MSHKGFNPEIEVIRLNIFGCFVFRVSDLINIGRDRGVLRNYLHN